MPPSALLLLLLHAAACAESSGTSSLPAEFERIKRTLPNLSFLEAKKLLASARSKRGRVPKTQSKIEHMVVLFVENRASDHIFGCMLGDRPGFDGIPTRADGEHWKLFPKAPGSGAGPAKEMVNISCGTADWVCSDGPADTHLSHRMFNGSQLPIKRAISEHFAVFNKYFTSTPNSSSWPNHLFAQSATSCGTTQNVMYNACGGQTAQFPQMTIFDSMAMANVPFSLFVNDTCGPHTNMSCGDVQPGWWCKDLDPGLCTNGSTAASTGLDPDVTMVGVARHKKRFFSHSLFYEQAAAGTLPAFSWISPAHEASDHPCFDIAKGERLLKDVYEALRNGKGWEKTLFVVAYDDYGGFYDQVPPPASPNDESPCNVWNAQHNVSKGGNTTCPVPFDFRRLGPRAAAMLISPWVEKQSIIQEPTRRADGRDVHASGDPPPQWDHGSIPATAKALFNLPGFLTKRDAWAGSFAELLLDAPRADTPLHLPDAPPNAAPWGPPHAYGDEYDDDSDSDSDSDSDDGGGRGEERARRRGRRASAGEARVAVPQHCSSSSSAGREGVPVCFGPHAVTQKQRRLIELYSALTHCPAPDVDALDYRSAGAWTKARWNEYMATHDGDRVVAAV